MNIVLTGFMASGKTQISKAIAAASKYKLIDTDDMIVEAAGKSINRIFSEDGETEFRLIERDAICRAAALDGYVIATGGGVPTNRANMDELRKNGIIVNLAPNFSVIQERLESARSSRPLLRNQSIDEIKKRFDDRKPFYEECDIKINIINGRTPHSYAIEILKAVESYIKTKR
ncbi:MAG: shikimate kinase [Oscillospiraceae bacterium]|nr:shikimate kinase [Oscillospiraceae bacterium]